MKIQKIILVIVLSVIATGSVFSQKKIGVFVHGFNGSSEKWLQESKVPQNWKSDGIINNYIALDYKTEELETVQSQAVVLNRFITEMNRVGNKSDEWIIIGHSLGGIVGRLLYPRLRQAGYNVVAVTSIGGPSQGAAAADVSISTIEGEINRIKTNFEKATDNEWPALSFVLALGQLYASSFSELGLNVQTPRDQLNQIPVYLDAARDTAVGYAERILDSGANNKIGLNGILIQEINGFDKNNINLHPQNYLSIIGAEKNQAPIRMIGHIFEDEKTKDEVSNLKQLEDFENEYLKPNQRHWNRLADRYATLCAWYSKSCRRSRDTARRKEGYWKTARRELHNLGKTWSVLINSYTFSTEVIEVWEPDCAEDGSSPGGFYSIGDACIITGGQWVTKTATIATPDKNDGVVNIHSVLWSKGDSFENDHNRYFSDIPADGGYNHFELRNHKRAYILSGYFNKGDKNPAMEEVEKWITRDFEF